MTEEQFKKANNLNERIEHLTTAIDRMEKADLFKLDPPSRMSGYCISTYNGTEVILSEEEVICIVRAFENLRDNLREEFRKL